MAACEFEEMCLNADQVQKSVLRSILQENAACEYLRTCGLGSPSELARLDDEDLVSEFKRCVPIISYPQLRPFIQRIIDGDTSPILTSAPIPALGLSSGTSEASHKYIPYSEGLKTGTLDVARFAAAFRDRVYPISPGARILDFTFSGSCSTTKGGLCVGTMSTHLIHSDVFNERQRNLRLTPCCPSEVMLTHNFQQGMYCALLCGLVYAIDVEVINAVFGYTLVEALRTLTMEWKSLCHDIKIGHLNAKITEPSLRVAIMGKVLTCPNAQFATRLEDTCNIASLQSWKGVVKQLWPKCKYLLSIMTGTMEVYEGILKHYMGNEVALVCADYGASEGWVGANINPLSSPKNVSFTVVPSLGYFEFIPLLKSDCDSSPPSSHKHLHKEAMPVNLISVKVGQDYEIVMTTRGGLYRYCLGDILRVTGFFNHTPQFAYVCRKNVVLSINFEKTTDEDLKQVVEKVSNKLQVNSNMKVIDYTSYADMKNHPPHYVIVWEVEGAGQDNYLENQRLLANCATWMDASFIDPGYVLARKIGTIGALELCIVRQGTFTRLLHCFMSSSGASITQYKTPRCILASSSNMMSILQENTLVVHFSSLKF